jgi:hypothetical protein
MDADHSFVLQPQAGGTRVVHQETFRGVLVPLLAGSLDRRTLPAFQAMDEALEQRVQQLRRAGAGTRGPAGDTGAGARA